VRPPGEPVTSTSRPSRATIVGVIELSIRLSGAIRLAGVPMSPVSVVEPGRRLKSPISLLSRKPVPGTTRWLPNEASSVVVVATAIPSASTTEKCVVWGDSGAGGPRRSPPRSREELTLR